MKPTLILKRLKNKKYFFSLFLGISLIFTTALSAKAFFNTTNKNNNSKKIITTKLDKKDIIINSPVTNIPQVLGATIEKVKITSPIAGSSLTGQIKIDADIDKKITVNNIDIYKNDDSVPFASTKVLPYFASSRSFIEGENTINLKIRSLDQVYSSEIVSFNVKVEPLPTNTPVPTATPKPKPTATKAPIVKKLTPTNTIKPLAPVVSGTMQQRLLDLINNLRNKNGLPPYSLNSKLQTAATNYSQLLAKMNCSVSRFHNCDGTTVYIRAINAGYTGSYLIENIAAGQATPEEVMDRWTNPKYEASWNYVHLNQLLDKKAKDIGIGFYSNTGPGWSTYWVMDAGV